MSVSWLARSEPDESSDHTTVPQQELDFEVW